MFCFVLHGVSCLWGYEFNFNNESGMYGKGETIHLQVVHGKYLRSFFFFFNYMYNYK